MQVARKRSADALRACPYQPRGAARRADEVAAARNPRLRYEQSNDIESGRPAESVQVARKRVADALQACPYQPRGAARRADEVAAARNPGLRYEQSNDIERGRPAEGVQVARAWMLMNLRIPKYRCGCSGCPRMEVDRPGRD